jgi:FkbM family methyltransferase
MPLPGYLVDNRLLLETVSRRESKAVFIGEGIVLCRVLGTYFMFADADDLGIAPHFALNGYWESEVTLAIARAVKPGSWCLDVGANHGYYTLIFAAGTGPKGHVTAVEPNPRSVDLMYRTFDVNGFLDYVDVVSTAMSDRDGETIKFFVPKHRGMNARVVADEPTHGTTIETRTDTIDHLASDWPQVDVVKIDVEGSEQAVWRGMQRVLSENRNITVFLEVNAARYDNPISFLSEIEDAGFSLRHVDLDGEPRHVTREQIAATRHDWILLLRRDADSPGK